jgi:1,4-dihydroxy-2-naphthoyl-CoA synthase
MREAREIVAVSPHAVREAKELLTMCDGWFGDRTVSAEANRFGLMFSHHDSKAGLPASIRKQRPVWKEDV